MKIAGCPIPGQRIVFCLPLDSTCIKWVSDNQLKCGEFYCIILEGSEPRASEEIYFKV